MRLAVIASHPIQYQAPLYRALAAKRHVETKVFFCWDFGVESRFDVGFGREVLWDVPLLEGYDHEFVPNRSPRPGTHHFFGLLNTEVAGRLERFQPDAVLVHGYAHFTEWAVAAWALRRGVPLLFRGESHLVAPRARWVRFAKRLGLPPLMKSVAAALAIGTHNEEYLRHYGVPTDRIVLAPYTVDNAWFAARRESAEREARRWRTELGIPDHHKVVLYAAKFIPVKGCEDLVRAFAAARLDGATLVLVGAGPSRDAIERAAANVPSVRFAGFVNQSRMPAAYRLGDVFVLPSHREPWGLAVNEAMNLGLPVIVSDQVGCAPDLVHDENGWVFPAGNVDALRRTLVDACSDGDRLRAKGVASAKRIATWGIPETVAGYVAGVERAVSLRRRAA